MQNFSITYSGVAKEEALTLSRGTKWAIREVRVSYANNSAGGKIILSRKASETTANNRNPAHADSVGVWVGETYLNNGDLNLEDKSGNKITAYDSYRSTIPRLYLDFSDTSGIAYVTVVYDFIE